MLNIYETITIVIVAVSILFLILFAILDRLQYWKKQYLYHTVVTIIFLLIVELFVSREAWDISLYLYPPYVATLFLIYPYLYLYHAEILESVTALKPTVIWKHFILFFITLIISISFYAVLNRSERIDLIKGMMVLNLDMIGVEQVYFIVIYALYYAQFIYYIYKLWQLASYSANIETKLNGRFRSWIYIFITSVVLYELLLFVVTFYVSEEINQILNQFFGLIVLTFVGILAIKQSTFQLALKINAVDKIHNQSKSISLTKDEKNEIARILENYLKEKKIYLNPNLKLNDLARRIHIPEKKLSFVINQVYSANFNKFINSFRIEKAKNILLEQDLNKIENLYLLSGFNSRGTFNRAFKENTDLTPREFYIKNNSKS